MAKRFTDTNKWAKQSFSDLSVKMKLVWIYLCDNCDHAGIWDLNLGLMSFQIGTKVTIKELTAGLGDKITIVGGKVFIPSFFEFQYGSSKEGFKAKQSALSKLQELGLCDSEGKIKSPEHLGNCPEQSTDCPSISIGKGIGKSKNKELREKIEKIYLDHYPLKKGKERGLDRILKNFEEYELPFLEKAILAYKADCERNNTESKYIKHFSTFVNDWREWLDPKAGSSTLNSNSENDRYAFLKKGAEAS